MGLIVVVLVADAVVAPPAHEVHSIGGTAVNVAMFPSTNSAWWDPGPPSQSVSDQKCVVPPNHDQRCTSAETAAAFPGLHQTANTLYYVWDGCLSGAEVGHIIPWAGYNVEYFALSRSLVLHCYAATQWLYFPAIDVGVAISGGNGTLLAIPTYAIGAGSLSLRQDDRREHLVGDQSTEYELATATLS
ncbi:MAG TPA: hypothetical protein VFB69_08360 [Candidatus Dormibacteraeota bacterium]|nr:hypothetical protein [Candidatus Dormibacteraeota bacterium]